MRGSRGEQMIICVDDEKREKKKEKRRQIKPVSCGWSRHITHDRAITETLCSKRAAEEGGDRKGEIGRPKTSSFVNPRRQRRQGF